MAVAWFDRMAFRIADLAFSLPAPFVVIDDCSYLHARRLAPESSVGERNSQTLPALEVWRRELEQRTLRNVHFARELRDQYTESRKRLNGPIPYTLSLSHILRMISGLDCLLLRTLPDEARNERSVTCTIEGEVPTCFLRWDDQPKAFDLLQISNMAALKYAHLYERDAEAVSVFFVNQLRFAEISPVPSFVTVEDSIGRQLRWSSPWNEGTGDSTAVALQ